MLELGKVSARSAIEPLVFAGVLGLFFFTALILLLLGNYARKEEVQGRVLTRDVVRITSERTAHIREVLVVPGEAVKKDQPLVRVRPLGPQNLSEGSDKTLSAQSAERLNSLLEDTQADEQQARSTHAAQDKLRQLQIDQLHKDLELNQRIKQSIQRRMQIVVEQRQRHERLAREGAVSRTALNEVIVRHEATLQDLANNDLAHASARQRILELEQRGNDAGHALSSRLSELARQRHELRERLEALNKDQEYLLLSPVDGVVDAVSVFAGARAESGHPMMLLRIHQQAQATPSVMLDVSPSAIGFATPGTEVIVRLDAFPYERYGVVKGQIVRSTASTYLETPAGVVREQAQAPVYLVEVALDFADPRTRIRPQWLKDGMTLRGSLRLERLSLWQWLFLPALKGIERNPDYLGRAPAGPPPGLGA